LWNELPVIFSAGQVEMVAIQQDLQGCWAQTRIGMNQNMVNQPVMVVILGQPEGMWVFLWRMFFALAGICAGARSLVKRAVQATGELVLAGVLLVDIHGHIADCFANQ
jgi:hypothetical protein